MSKAYTSSSLGHSFTSPVRRNSSTEGPRPPGKSHKLDINFLLNEESSMKNRAVRRYECKVCHSLFAQRNDANKHVRAVHDKERPFQCPTCEKSFAEKGNLNKHIKSVHLNDRPFGCTLCPATFSFKDGLQRHMILVHSDMRPYKCEMCGDSFKQNAHLRKHSCPSSSSSSTNAR